MHRGQFPGAVELNPHNVVHGLVGGDMAGFQSPLDPLFWIHHCNIDRLWETWLSLGHSNPVDRAWLDTSFEFPDPEQQRRTLKVSDVLPASTAGYAYDELDLPMPGPDGLNIIGGEMPNEPRRDDRLKVLGASGDAGSVSAPSRIGLAPAPAGGPQGIAPPDIGASVSEDTLFLRLENVGMDAGDASSLWNVYIQGDAEDERHLAGTIAPFGLAGLTASGGRQTFTFDISALLEELRGSREIEVTCVPVRESAEGSPYWERAALYTTEPDA
jgi:tyrosinase